MRFTSTPFTGAYLVEPELIADQRGFFSRSFCAKEFLDQGIKGSPVQCNISFNIMRGTLRGMHFQQKPFAEAKLVRCTAGSIYDVIIDLRQNSPTFCQWKAFELTAENRTALYIPEGFAHGFQTLADDTEVFYQMFNFFEPKCAGGIRWDDPMFTINWPLNQPIMSAKDSSYADYDGFTL